MDKEREFKEILNFESQKNIYDSNVKIKDIKKINMFSDYENIL
jgi:hypothetical protein